MRGIKNLDSPIPTDIIELWFSLEKDTSQFKTLKIPRRILLSIQKPIWLVAFCDASSKAYAAVVYTVQETGNGTYTARLAFSKAKVVYDFATA